jgi:hypothetical protein
MFTIGLGLMLYLLLLGAATDSSSPPDQPVGWQAGSSRGGTWVITSNCLSTIFACTWSVQHLNIPQGDKWSLSLQKFKWMVIMILFPELGVIHAIFEFTMALEALRLMEQDIQKSVALPWWLPPRALSSLPPQRRLRFPSCLACSLSRFRKPREDMDIERQSIQDGPKWTFTHCFFANMGGLYYEGAQEQFPLTALQLARDVKGFERPSITKEEIQDKSKQDWFAKGVAALQFLQLALSLIVRTNQGLAFSQLETITLGFAVCGMVTYCIYLYKPQNVATRTLWPQRSESL